MFESLLLVMYKPMLMTYRFPLELNLSVLAYKRFLLFSFSFFKYIMCRWLIFNFSFVWFEFSHWCSVPQNRSFVIRLSVLIDTLSAILVIVTTYFQQYNTQYILFTLCFFMHGNVAKTVLVCRLYHVLVWVLCNHGYIMMYWLIYNHSNILFSWIYNFLLFMCSLSVIHSQCVNELTWRTAAKGGIKVHLLCCVVLHIVTVQTVP